MPYILANASYNDIVMIHGLDRISVESWDYLKVAVEAAKSKGVRFAYLLDDIGSGTANWKAKGRITTLTHWLVACHCWYKCHS